jgi:hypothetical protein
MFAKKFFYVCAGIFLLAASYHLGARSATATGLAGMLSGGELQYENGVRYASFAVNRVFYGFATEQSGTAYAPLTTPSQPIPGTASIESTLELGDNFAFVLLSNGDAYVSDTGAPWQYQGNLTSQTTATQSESWGQLKARYRGNGPREISELRKDKLLRQAGAARKKPQL